MKVEGVRKLYNEAAKLYMNALGADGKSDRLHGFADYLNRVNVAIERRSDQIIDYALTDIA